MLEERKRDGAITLFRGKPIGQYTKREIVEHFFVMNEAMIKCERKRSELHLEVLTLKHTVKKLRNRGLISRIFNWEL